MRFNSLDSRVALVAGCVAMIMSGTVAIEAGEASASNPLLERWVGPYGGVPAFDRYQVGQFEPALEAGMAEQLAEIDRIASDPAKPDSLRNASISGPHSSERAESSFP